jgi:hypothetical protein
VQDSSGAVLEEFTFTWDRNRTLTFNFGPNLPAEVWQGTPFSVASGGATVNLLAGVPRPDGSSVTFDYVDGNSDWGIVKTIKEIDTDGKTVLYYVPASERWPAHS